MFLIFGVLVIGLLLISPLSFISDYPPEIQEAEFPSKMHSFGEIFHTLSDK